jgi:transposase InsO family protein
MESTRNALRATLAANPRPYQITIDNGKEFVGTTFQQILAESETLDHRTHPYSPEENGKIERFWETLDATIDYSQSYSLIGDFIHEYNEIWPHMALCRTEDGHRIEAVPGEVWRLGER